MSPPLAASPVNRLLTIPVLRTRWGRESKRRADRSEFRVDQLCGEGFLSELHAVHIDLLLLHGRSERCRRQDAEQMIPGIALRSKSKAS